MSARAYLVGNGLSVDNPHRAGTKAAERFERVRAGLVARAEVERRAQAERERIEGAYREARALLAAGRIPAGHSDWSADQAARFKASMERLHHLVEMTGRRSYARAPEVVSLVADIRAA